LLQPHVCGGDNLDGAIVTRSGRHVCQHGRDNATSNDSELIKSLNLHPNINITANNHIRCAGHIINLVVKAALYGKGVADWEQRLANAAPKDQFKLWRELGVVGRLHNFVNTVCASHNQRKLFSSMQRRSTLISYGSSTPWSFVKMAASAGTASISCYFGAENLESIPIASSANTRRRQASRTTI
jgi:hypothetical protein